MAKWLPSALLGKQTLDQTLVCSGSAFHSDILVDVTNVYV